MTRALAALAGLVVAAGCSSSGSSHGSTSETSASTPAGTGGQAGGSAVTGGTVKIDVITLNLTALEQAGILPDLGNTTAQFDALGKEINAAGLAGKYTVDVTVHELPAVATSDDYRAACLQATEQDHAFVVVLPSVQDDQLAECIATEHKTMLLSDVGFSDQVYKDAGGLVMTGGSNASMTLDAQEKAWVDVSAAEGLLNGRKIGVVLNNADPTLVRVINDVLIPEIKAKGYSVTDEFVLPCPVGSTACTEQDVAAAKMKSEGVNFVFNAAETLSGVELVAAASKIGWTPTWSADRNTTTDTVAGFFQSVADAFQGAYGISVEWPDSTFSPETRACNAQAATYGVAYKPTDNAYAAFGDYCILMDTLAKGIKMVSGPLTTSALIRALLAIHTVPSNTGPAGTWAPGKLAAADNVFAVRYDKNGGRTRKGGFVSLTNPVQAIKVDDQTPQ